MTKQSKTNDEKFMPDCQEAFTLAQQIISNIMEDIKSNQIYSTALAAPWYTNLKSSYVFLDEDDHYDLKYGIEFVKHEKIHELYNRFTVNSANLLRIINLIKDNYANKEWSNDWIYTATFKEICNTPIEIPGLTCPPMDSAPLSGVFLLYCLYENKFYIPGRPQFDDSFQQRQYNNSFYSSFNYFAKSIPKLLEWKFVDSTTDVLTPLLAISNKRAEKLYWIFSLCNNLSNGMLLKSTLSKDDIYYTDITSIHTGPQKQFLLLQTLLYIHLPAHNRHYFLMEEWEISLQLIKGSELCRTLDEFYLRRSYINKLAADDNPDIISLIYQRIELLQKTIFVLHYQDFLREIAAFVITNIPNEYIKTLNAINKPLGWPKVEYHFHKLTKREISNSVACSWEKFYSKNEYLLKSTFPKLSAEQLKELWEIAQTVFLVINHKRYELNLDEIDKLTNNNRVNIIKKYKFNANTYMPEFLSTMITCHMLEGIPAKKLQISKFSDLHKKTSGRCITKNIQTYVKESPCLIPLIDFFIKWTNNILLLPFLLDNGTKPSEPISRAYYQR
jgi:hypothetical protein